MKNYARVMGDKHQAGCPMSVPDGQIAAIALANGFALATRNIKDFEDCGVELLNPIEGDFIDVFILFFQISVKVFMRSMFDKRQY